MGKWQVWKELRIALADPTRLGDVAVYKSELAGSRAAPELETQLDDVRSYRPKVDLEGLAQLPEGSFGHRYQAFMRDNGLDCFEISERPPADMVERNAFVARYGIIHDMVHVLTGFDTSWPGEVGVWAFVGGQGYSRGFRFAAVMALVAALFRCPMRLGEAWSNFRRGWTMGRTARPLITLRLEEYFERELSGLRQEFGLPVGGQDQGSALAQAA